jgi:ADP-ribosylglycohydrolase
LPEPIRGMLLGLAIGDALGNTSESLRSWSARLPWRIRDYLPNSRSAGRRVGCLDDSQLAF